MNPCWGGSWNGMKICLNWQLWPGLFWGQRAAHAALSLPNAAQREGNGKKLEKKSLERPSPVFLWADLTETSPRAFLDFLKLWWALQEGPSFTQALSASLANWSQLSWGLRSSRSTIPLFFPFISKSTSPKNWQPRTQGSIKFQITRDPRTEFQTGKKSAGLGAWCVGHPQEFQLKNNSQRAQFTSWQSKNYYSSKAV